MATYTSKFNLTKQAGGENQSLPILNQNLDTIDQEMNKSRPLPLSKSSVSSLPTTITDSRITATMICPPGGMRLSSPSAQGGDWTISTAAGSVTISGTIRGTTTIYLWLEEPMT